MKKKRRKKGIRFQKRLTAVLLAAAMLFTSAQLSGGISYAAQLTDGAEMTGGQPQLDDAVVTDSAIQKDEEDTTSADTSQSGDDTLNEGQPGGESQEGEDGRPGEDNTPEDSSQTEGGGDQPGDEGQPGDGQPEDESQPGGNESGDESQPGSGGQPGNDNPGGGQIGEDDQPGEDNPAGDASQTEDNSQSNDGTGAEEIIDAGQISGNDLEGPVSDVQNAADVEETVEFTIDGAYQFGGSPVKEQKAKSRAAGELAALNASGYEDGLETYLYEQMKRRQGTINIQDYNVTDTTALGRVVSGVLNDHPDLYYVKNSWRYGTGGGKVLFLMCTYSVDYDDAAFEANTQEALSCVIDGMSDYAKATVLHDYLALNIAYDYDNYQADTIPADSYSAYGALVNGTAVCEGYALAYKYLLSELGIESYMVKSTQMNHAWNMVKIDGKYYHVDVTWDDPVYDRIGRVRHVYLFRSDDNFDAASSGKPHYGWVVTSGGSTVNYQATDTTYESTFWTKSNAPLVFDGGDCYYITGSGGLNRADFSNLTGEGTPLVDNIGRWPVWGSATSFYTSVFSGLYRINNRLYYNDATSIYSISPDGSDKRTEFTADTSTGYICGSAYRKGRVYYCLKQNPNEQKKETLLTVEFGAANLTQEYQTVTDQTVTAEADGRPKMLVFFKMDDTNSDDALNAIELILDGAASGIDVYAVETEKAGKEALKDNYQGYTDITFCYDTTEGNKNRMKAFAEAGGISTDSENYPVICYIDKYNHLRYVSAGENSVGSIQDNMRIYCQYPDAAYKITYVLNGGTNHVDNPTVYTTEGVTLQDASREGFTFCGWYKDAAFIEKVTQIPAGSSENLTLYAKWLKQGEGLNLANPEYTFTTIEEKTVSSTADGSPKVLFYFRQGCSMCQSTSLELRGHIKAFAGVDIYAIDIDGKTKSEVSAFKTNYGCEGITYCYGSGYSSSMQKYVEDAGILGIATPVIVYISADNRYQGCTLGSKSWSEVLENLQKFCGYDYYYIKYELDGGENDSANPEMYQSGKRDVVLKDASKLGYEFQGWYRDAAFAQEVTQIPAESSENLTLYAKWQRREEKLDLDNPNRTFATIDGQRINSTADGRPKVLFFFKVGCANCEAASTELREHISAFGDADIYAIETSNVTRDQVAAFKEQYGCDEITYSYEEIDHMNRDIMTVYYKTAQYGGTVETPFIVYISADNRFQWYTMGNRSWSQMLGDLQKYCDYEPPKEGVYRITYELNGGTNDAANPATYTAETGTIVLKDAVKVGYVFDGWYRDAAFTEKVTQIAKGSTGGITLYAKWKLKGYGLANLDQTYTALDDMELSSKADGKPKLLVFYRYSASDTVSVVNSIASTIGGLGGVDIYAVSVITLARIVSGN